MSKKGNLMQKICFAVLTLNLLIFNGTYANETTELDDKDTGSGSGVELQVLLDQRDEHLVKHNKLERQLSSLKQERSRLPPSTEDILSRKRALEDRIRLDEERLAALQAEENPDIQKVNELTSYISDDKYSIGRYERDSKRLLELDAEIKIIENEFVSNSKKLKSIERKIQNVLNIEKERNDFRTLISITFCVLVAMVILGFYFIAWKKENIAVSIFSGEKGIQFVTIFLIVIAIILFGIMGVLESKELSALLGGLSGYILGRSTRSNDHSQA